MSMLYEKSESTPENTPDGGENAQRLSQQAPHHRHNARPWLLFGLMAALLLGTGYFQNANIALGIINMCLISAIMAIGLNIQWGFAGLFNVAVMGFIAIGGLMGVLVAMPPVQAAWQAGGVGMLTAAVLLVLLGILLLVLHTRLQRHRYYCLVMLLAITVGLWLVLQAYYPARSAIEAVNPSLEGYLGGLGLPIMLSWLVGGLAAAGIAWLIGKVSLGLRADYLAIATLGIAEIIIAVLKNEEWLSRGVKNVVGLPRPVPYEIDLQQNPLFISLMHDWGMNLVEASALMVKLCYFMLFASVLLLLLWLSERMLHSPWGRMMRAIRDNETAARAMGKDVKQRHLRLFVLGSAIIGMAGAMMTTLDGQFVPGTYHPLRFTFLIWVMVIIGGSGNNYGSILGGFLVWFFWVQSEILAQQLMYVMTLPLVVDNPIRLHLLENAGQSRLIMMGLVLLCIVRFAPKGLIPEVVFRRK